MTTSTALTPLEAAVAYLEGMNADGTRERNDVGWNRQDAGFGRAMAEQIGRWTPNQHRAAWRLVQKYRATQLAPAGIHLPEREPDHDAEARRPTSERRPEPDAEVVVDGGRIAVRAPFRFKDDLKAIPGARWDAARKMWTYPESPAVGRALAAVLGANVPDGVLGALLGQARREDAAAAALKNDGRDLPEIPGLAGTSWPHQRAGYWWAKDRQAAMLAYRMRYGKTRVAVGLAQDARAVLVLCPLSVVAVWPAEFDKHCPARSSVRTVVALDRGSVADKCGKAVYAAEVAARHGRQLVVVVNFDSARSDPLASWLTARDWDLVVLDESHRVKAPGGVTSLFVSKLRDRARRRLCLTGTPMPHSPLDVYAQYRFLDPGIFGTSFLRFRNRYAVMGGYGNHQVVGWRDLDDLNRRVYSAAYKPPDDIVQMPEELHVDRMTRLGMKGQRAYDQLEAGLFAAIDEGTITASNVLVQLLRLAQLAGGVLTTDDGQEVRVDDAKPNLLRDVLEDLGDEPVVVLCRFHADLDAVHEQAAALGLTSSELSGRRREIDDWQAGRTQVLAVQIQAGGVGINLSRADVMVVYSVGFSLGDWDQALARIRVSGKPSVQYVHLTVEGTVDQKIRRALEERADLVEAALRRPEK